MIDLQKQLAATARQCYEEGLFAGTSGNLSVYDRESRLVAITPSGVPYPSLRDDDIVLIRPDGSVVTGRYKPSSEWPMHAAIYKAKPEMDAVVHTHSPFATAFAVAGKPVPLAMIEMALYLKGEVPLAPFALAGSDELARGVVTALQSSPACLMQNHGMVAVGKSLDEAHMRAIYVEDAAKICTYAAIHGDITSISDEDAEEMRRRRAGK